MKDYRSFSKVIWKDRNLGRLYVHGNTSNLCFTQQRNTYVCVCAHTDWKGDLFLNILMEKNSYIRTKCVNCCPTFMFLFSSLLWNINPL